MNTKEKVLLEVRKIFAKVTKQKLDKVEPKSNIHRDLGGDSLSQMEMIMLLEKEFLSGEEIPDKDSEKLLSPLRATNYLLENMPRRWEKVISKERKEPYSPASIKEYKYWGYADKSLPRIGVDVENRRTLNGGFILVASLKGTEGTAKKYKFEEIL